MNFEDFSEKTPGFPSPHSANTQLYPGNIGAFSDFFQNSNKKWSKVNKVNKKLEPLDNRAVPVTNT